jgi:hypothetical protein
MWIKQLTCYVNKEVRYTIFGWSSVVQEIEKLAQSSKGMFPPPLSLPPPGGKGGPIDSLPPFSPPGVGETGGGGGGGDITWPRGQIY